MTIRRKKRLEYLIDADDCGYCYKDDPLVTIPATCPSTMERYCK